MPALRRRGPMHEINIVPYVDVMLVLLVIFMVTAPLITPGVIDLPTVDKAGQPRVPLSSVLGHRGDEARGITECGCQPRSERHGHRTGEQRAAGEETAGHPGGIYRRRRIAFPDI